MYTDIGTTKLPLI